ncbi:lmo0937 family membrane protein [bacterium]|nr:lmo0937 family membrane protein [bacterium]
MRWSWIIAVVLFIVWLALLLGYKSIGWWLHLLLVLAVIFILYTLFKGRKSQK